MRLEGYSAFRLPQAGALASTPRTHIRRNSQADILGFEHLVAEVASVHVLHRCMDAFKTRRQNQFTVYNYIEPRGTFLIWSNDHKVPSVGLMAAAWIRIHRRLYRHRPMIGFFDVAGNIVLF
jgi:hypothetical protein